MSGMPIVPFIHMPHTDVSASSGKPGMHSANDSCSIVYQIIRLVYNKKKLRFALQF